MGGIGGFNFFVCEAYEVGWDFVIAPEQQKQSQSQSSTK